MPGCLSPMSRNCRPSCTVAAYKGARGMGQCLSPFCCLNAPPNPSACEGLCNRGFWRPVLFKGWSNPLSQPSHFLIRLI